MRGWGLLGLALLLLSSCGDSDAAGARTAAQVCDEICGWPDACFVQLGVPVQGAECVQSCEAQADLVGLGCDFESLTDQQILSCQSVALAIDSACE